MRIAVLKATDKMCDCCAGLEQAGKMRTKETVLITAAAGGTGQFAVQLAKAAGNRVLATCGSDDKAQMLQQLGADRAINYKQEDLKQVLWATCLRPCLLQRVSYDHTLQCALVSKRA